MATIGYASSTDTGTGNTTATFSFANNVWGSSSGPITSGSGRPSREDQIARAKASVIQWAKNVLEEDFMVLSMNTTGLDPKKDEVIQLAVMDGTGRWLLDELIRPVNKKEFPEASGIHGIYYCDLADMDTFARRYDQIKEVFGRKPLYVYNGEFAENMLKGACSQAEKEPFGNEFICIMKAYAEYVGDLGYYGFKNKRLGAATHRAADKCSRTLDIIYEIAECPEG